MGLTAEQVALRDAIRAVLRRHRPPAPAGATPAGLDWRLWRSLCEVGIAGLAIPERFGGAGAGPVETAVAAEEIGRVLAPVPLLGSAVLAAQAILASGDDACARLVPPVAAGTAIAALAWTGPEGGWDPARAACRAAGAADGGWSLTGTAHYVLDGDVADVLVVAARPADGGIGLFEVDPGAPGVARRAVPAMDQSRRLAVVEFTGAPGRPLGRSRPVPHPALARARDLACVALAAEQAGAAARALELTVAHASTRVQFGRPIASFQAVQHRLAQLHALVESARALAYRAAEVSAADEAGAPLLAAAAKAHCSQVLEQVAAETIQLHGAIGITWEHDAHRYFKRAHGSAHLFGPPSAHLARIASIIIRGG